jgi:nitroreductase
VLLGSSCVWGQTLQPIVLPEPVKTGGKPLMQCLAERHSSRDFAATPLTPAVLANLLWAGWGINRADGHRTAPSARNWQEITLYAVTDSGAYVYDAAKNWLMPAASGDLRALTGMQPFPAEAPLNLLYVADYDKMGEAPDDQKAALSSADAAFIAENVYLFCASENLAVVVRASIEKDPLAKALNLKPSQHIVLAQTIGHMAK